MGKIVGVRFRPAGKIYDFDSGAFVLQAGDHVIVETKHGLGYGQVAVDPVAEKSGDAKQPLRKIYRKATDKDLIRIDQNQQTAQAAHHYCQQCIGQLGLEMNLFQVESTFDGSKLTFFFTADGRVDFRQLVKMLVRELKVRIEMRQVAIRNRAKLSGGMGRCGREICCATFIDHFNPVSIRMAKNQGLSLNPTKISGLCGRLMCCLRFENDSYAALKKQLPRLGTNVKTPDGVGRVIRQNPIALKVTIKLKSGGENDYAIDQLEL
jgi:cell fate regulator YaaT (PSP1 superfamily)